MLESISRNVLFYSRKDVLRAKDHGIKDPVIKTTALYYLEHTYDLNLAARIRYA